MKIKIIGYLTICALCALMLGCDDDDKDLSSIEGRWSGDRAALTVNLIPINEDDFDVVLDFKEDGTVILTEDNNTITGTYKVSGDDLTLTGINMVSIPVTLEGNYDIKELTNNRLVIEGEREGQYTHPDYGTITGKVKATLYFNKTN
ncbi:lipocalin family protein [Chryseosolibacter indicus]|uniref:Lipocalin-like domain-containing protein n=1 Tax=Chryseosolibacter indicus TaxID=2782351 RepID=A0ABS5VPW0_9BACT|nr:lipocalin family protein [Chryseosolibacter indicus]MBT1702814.1 hypothetical protein [Chryseosolibacter indicus]